MFSSLLVLMQIPKTWNSPVWFLSSLRTGLMRLALTSNKISARVPRFGVRGAGEDIVCALCMARRRRRTQPSQLSRFDWELAVVLVRDNFEGKREVVVVVWHCWCSMSPTSSDRDPPRCLIPAKVQQCSWQQLLTQTPSRDHPTSSGELHHEIESRSKSSLDRPKDQAPSWSRQSLPPVQLLHQKRRSMFAAPWVCRSCLRASSRPRSAILALVRHASTGTLHRPLEPSL